MQQLGAPFLQAKQTFERKKDRERDTHRVQCAEFFLSKFFPYQIDTSDTAK